MIVHEATAGLFPHRLASDREEERRVFHVAVTRGQRSVLVASGSPPSPFVVQLSEPADPAAPPEPELRPTTPAPKPKKAREVPEVGSIEEATLRERLKAWRLETAKGDAIPAYRVFPDTTLYELARRRPASPPELLAVSGIGPAKVDAYGEAILAVIAESQPPTDQ